MIYVILPIISIFILYVIGVIVMCAFVDVKNKNKSATELINAKETDFLLIVWWPIFWLIPVGKFIVVFIYDRSVAVFEKILK